MSTTVTFNDFRYGVADEELRRRYDTEFYKLTAHKLENVIPIRTGGVELRPAAVCKFEEDDSSTVSALNASKRIIPFVLSVSIHYVLGIAPGMLYIFGLSADTNLYVLQYSCELTRTVSNVTTTYFTASQIPSVQYAHDYEKLILVHPECPPFVLQYSNGGWSANWMGDIMDAQTEALTVVTEEMAEAGTYSSDQIGQEIEGSYYQYDYAGLFDTADYPSVVTFCANRLWMGNSEAHPYRLWASRPFEHFNFQLEDYYNEIDETITTENYLEAIQGGSSVEISIDVTLRHEYSTYNYEDSLYVIYSSALYDCENFYLYTQDDDGDYVLDTSTDENVDVADVGDAADGDVIDIVYGADGVTIDHKVIKQLVGHCTLSSTSFNWTPVLDGAAVEDVKLAYSSSVSDAVIENTSGYTALASLASGKTQAMLAGDYLTEGEPTLAQVQVGSTVTECYMLYETWTGAATYTKVSGEDESTYHTSETDYTGYKLSFWENSTATESIKLSTLGISTSVSTSAWDLDVSLSTSYYLYYIATSGGTVLYALYGKKDIDIVSFTEAFASEEIDDTYAFSVTRTIDTSTETCTTQSAICNDDGDYIGWGVLKSDASGDYDYYYRVGCSAYTSAYSYSSTVYTQKTVVSEDCAMVLDMASDRDEHISWIAYSSDYIFVGTASSEWKMDYDIDACTASITKLSAFGSKEHLQCVYGGTSVLYVQSGGKRIRSITVSTDTSLLPENTEPTFLGTSIISQDYDGNAVSVSQLAWQRVDRPLLYCVLSDGTISVLEYDTTYGIQAWCHWTLTGLSAISLCVVDDEDGQNAIVLAEDGDGNHGLLQFTGGGYCDWGDEETGIEADVVTQYIDASEAIRHTKKALAVAVDSLGTEFSAGVEGQSMSSAFDYSKDLIEVYPWSMPMKTGTRIQIKNVAMKPFKVLAVATEVNIGG